MSSNNPDSDTSNRECVELRISDCKPVTKCGGGEYMTRT